ncbi:MAG: metalloregulator ArsR/SmtB family transcription factor [Stappiaceae bacterium]
MAIHYQTPLDRTFHALGDGTRRQIIAMLAAEGTRSASEICAPFEAAQPTISKHLKVLEKSGLISREIDGRTHRFRLNAAPMNDAIDWITRHKTFWEGTLSRLDEYVQTIDDPGAEK